MYTYTHTQEVWIDALGYAGVTPTPEMVDADAAAMTAAIESLGGSVEVDTDDQRIYVFTEDGTLDDSCLWGQALEKAFTGNNTPVSNEGRDEKVRYLMNINTGRVAPASEWEEEYEVAKAAGFPQESLWHEGDLESLEEVVRNIPGESGYDPDYGEWRPTSAEDEERFSPK